MEKAASAKKKMRAMVPKWLGAANVCSILAGNVERRITSIQTGRISRAGDATMGGPNSTRSSRIRFVRRGRASHGRLSVPVRILKGICALSSNAKPFSPRETNGRGGHSRATESLWKRRYGAIAAEQTDD